MIALELPDPEVVLKGALPPIGAALLLAGCFGARLTALAMGVGVYVAFWLLKERPEWPHELWYAPDGRQWLVWGLIAAGLVALLEHARALRGRFAAGAGVLVSAFVVWLVLQKIAARWDTWTIVQHVGGGGFVVALLVLAMRTTLARAPASLAPAVVFTLLLSALSVLLTLAASGLFGQLCGACAAALGAAAGTTMWRRPFVLAPADGTWLAAAFGLFVLAGKHFSELGWPAAGCAVTAPFALLLLQPGAAQRPFWWTLGAIVLAGVPMAGAFWFTLQAG